MFCDPSYYGPVKPFSRCMQQLVFGGSWLLGVALVLLLVWAWRRRKAWRRGDWLAWALLATLTPLLMYMRFVEPDRLEVRHTTLNLGFDARLALISDIHVGLFKDERYLARVVDKLNGLDVEAVLFAGDWTGTPTRPLPELLAPLKRLRHPLLSVPGNHDEEQPGPPLRKALRDALLAVGAKPVEYSFHRLANATVVGIGDRRARRDTLAPLARAPKDLPIVLLLHEPDSVMAYPQGAAALAVAGHTHGGQVRLPFVGYVTNSSHYPFDRGLHTFTPMPTFVTSGLGESGLPLRWLNPPVIDVLTIRRDPRGDAPAPSPWR